MTREQALREAAASAASGMAPHPVFGERYAEFGADAERERIVAGLSEAQKRAIRDASLARNTTIMVLPIYRDAGRISRSLVELELAGYSLRGAALTKLGKAVRAVLERGR